MEEEKEKKLKTYKNIRKISTITFIACAVLVINFIPFLYMHENGKAIGFIFLPPAILGLISLPLLLPLQILYFFLSSVYTYIKFKKIPYINIAAITIIGIFYTLYFTGFCFKDMRYWSKAEIIDRAVSAHVWHSCEQEYTIKYGYFPRKKGSALTDYDKITDKCSITFESVKQEAPQCFKDKRQDRCRGTVTHFDKETNTTIKSEIEIYSYDPFYARKIINYPYKKFEVESDLDLYRDGNRYVVSPCGVPKCYGCWD
ncbi:MAG: hypothetical protein LBF71_05880 [Campylobacteraceae bacterium]|jgi:hypothetical protein|nr:hypothetical protein [Campylobacteraceae bacterium]